MKNVAGRPPGILDQYWPDRLSLLLAAILSVQNERHTVSLRELENTCGVSRQTIASWLDIAEQLGYIDRHNGQPRAVQLLPKGRRLARKFCASHKIGEWKLVRRELGLEEGKNP